MKDSNATILGYCTSWCSSACTALTRYSVFTHQRSISKEKVSHDIILFLGLTLHFLATSQDSLHIN